jgi:hypothetical protein
MNKILGLVAISVGLIGAPALAQSTASVSISGSATALCSASGTFANIVVGDLVTAGTGGLNAAQINAKTADNTSALFCNGTNSTLTVSAAPITGGTPPVGMPTIFSNVINYTATASLLASGYASAGVEAADTTLTVGAADPVGLLSAPAGSLRITLSDAALPSGSTFLMAAASYAGAVTLTLAPVV